MTYEFIREQINKEKGSHQYEKMEVINHGRFCVIETPDGISGLIDSNIVDLVAKRRWCLDSGGYFVSNFGGCLIRLHDVVMATHHKEKPDNCYVDHINFDKLDNRIQNLRFVTPEESSHNMPLKSNNTTGITGVSKTRIGHFRAYITVNKKRIELGIYPTLQEAATARIEAETRLGFKTRPKNISFLLEGDKNNG